MMKAICFLTASLSLVSGFQPHAVGVTKPVTKLAGSFVEEEQSSLSRVDFLKSSALVGAAGLYNLVVLPSPALARGRATLEQSYDRYTPRIITGGEFYGGEFRKLVEKSDWKGIKAALAEPPKRSKEDKSKVDGGVSERAAQAGGFSDSRVVVACDLFAAAFSDNSVSPKTKKMKAEVEILREVVADMTFVAQQGLGEVSSGGLFGLGGKKPSPSELAKKMRDLYVKGGNAYNKYIFVANEELPVQLKKLPFLR